MDPDPAAAAVPTEAGEEQQAVIRQSISYHVIEGYTMTSIYQACSIRTYLHCIVTT